MNVLCRKKEVYQQIDKHFQCINIYSSKAIESLWVYPFMVLKLYPKKSPKY